MAVVPLESPHYVHGKMPPFTVSHPATSAPPQTSALSTIATSPNASKLLQLLPPSDTGKNGIPDLNACPIYVLDSSKNEK